MSQLWKQTRLGFLRYFTYQWEANENPHLIERYGRAVNWGELAIIEVIIVDIVIVNVNVELELDWIYDVVRIRSWWAQRSNVRHR